MLTAPGRLFLLAALPLCLSCPGYAQSTLPERALRLALSGVPGISDRPSMFTAWSFKRPVSFSYLRKDQISGANKLVHDAIVSRVFDSACIGRSLDKLEELIKKPSVGDGLDDRIKQIEITYIKEKKLSETDLTRYKERRSAYNEEVKRLSLLPKGQAEAEAYKLSQKETEWNLHGRRSDFRDLERRIASIPKPPVLPSPSGLRSEIFDAEGSLKFRLSVPVEQWGTFDSWVRLRRTSAAPAPQSPALKAAEPFDDGEFNKGSCKGGCTPLLPSNFASNQNTTVTFIAPQFELPWVTKYRSAVAQLSDPIEDCSSGTEIDRLFVIRSIGISYSISEEMTLNGVLAGGKPFAIDSLQFSGNPDIGVDYYSSPSFADGSIYSPYAHIVGYTTRISENKRIP